MNGLESVCSALDISVDLVRTFSRRVTREQVKKMEFLERSGSRDQTRAFLAVIGSGPAQDDHEEDDGDE